MKKIILSTLLTVFSINISFAMQKGAGMSSEQTRIYSINNHETAKKYELYMQDIQNRVKQTLQNKLKKTEDKTEKEKIESLLSQINEIIQSMGVLKFIVTFGGLPNYACQYKNIWNNSDQLKELLNKLHNIDINIPNLICRFMHVYDHNAFAGDLDMHSATDYLTHNNIGTYLIRISQKHTPGGFTFTYKKNLNHIENRCGFFFTGNNLELEYNSKTFSNLAAVIKFFENTLKAPITIYGISLGSFWKTKNKY